MEYRTRVSVPSFELGPPLPLTQASVAPSRLGPGGGGVTPGHTRLRECGVGGGGNPIPTKGQKPWLSVYSVSDYL